MAVGADPSSPCTVFFRLDEQDAQLPETRPDGLIIACDSESHEPDELEVHKAKLEEARDRQQVTDHSVTELLEKLKQLPGVSSRKLSASVTPSGRVEERHHVPDVAGAAGPTNTDITGHTRQEGQQDGGAEEVPKRKRCEWQLQSGLSGLASLPGSVQEERSIESPSRRFQRAVRQVVQGNRRGTSSGKDGKGQAPCFATVVAAAVAARNAQQAGAQVFHTPREKMPEAETLKASREDSGPPAGPNVGASLEFHTPRGGPTPVTSPRGGPAKPKEAKVSLGAEGGAGGVSSAPRSASPSPSVSRAASPEWTQRGLADRSLSPRTPRASSLSSSPANGSLLVRARRQGMTEEAAVEEAWHGWTLQCTPGGRFFHHHVASGTSQWETPPELIDVLGEWREVGDPGARYWHNAKLETSCWKDPRNCSSIHEAALDGNMAYLRLYAMAKGFVDAVNLKGRSALHNAAAAGQDEVIVHLLHQKADVNLPDQGLSTPLHWACRYGHQTAVQLLLQAGANVDACNMLGDTPLHEAAGLGQVSVLPVLIGAYANPWARNAELMDYEHMWADREDSDSHQMQALRLGGGCRPGGLAGGLAHLPQFGCQLLFLLLEYAGMRYRMTEEEHGWAPQVLDFTNFLGILVLFMGMAGAGCVTLRLTSSDEEDSALSETQLRVWASMPFCAITMGALPPAFQSYLVHADGHFEPRLDTYR
eukprot:s2309_g8.t3